jgi:hypothetical protein
MILSIITATALVLMGWGVFQSYFHKNHKVATYFLLAGGLVATTRAFL